MRLFARVSDSSITANLSPAAGSGIGKLVAEALLAMPDFIPMMRDAFAGALQANIYFRSKDGRTVEEKPDYRIRLQAVTLCLAHMEGEPIQRIIHQHLGDGKAVDPLAALRDSPALLAAVEREVEKAKWRHSGKGEHKRPGAKRVEAIEIEPPET